MKNIRIILSENFQFLEVNFSIYLNRHVFVTNNIRETCLYNFDPLKPHFYIVKLGFTGVYIIFHISAQNIDCGYSLEPPRQGSSNEYYNLCFEQKYEKYQNYFI